MRLDELVPDSWIWIFGTIAMLLAGSLFAYEIWQPDVRAEASSRAIPFFPIMKESPFLDRTTTTDYDLARLPELHPKYKSKVFYVRISPLPKPHRAGLAQNKNTWSSRH